MTYFNLTYLFVLVSAYFYGRPSALTKEWTLVIELRKIPILWSGDGGEGRCPFKDQIWYGDTSQPKMSLVRF